MQDNPLHPEQQENRHHPTPVESLYQDFQKLWKSARVFFHDVIDLHEGLDAKGTIDTIKNNKKIKGSNIWLLFASIVIASVGLDINSQAVIIGAMLISPLMSPILGVGLAVGINDRKVLYTSLTHFGIAIAVTLISSTLYFLITPLGVATEEIIARTRPTILDVMVAFFGGVAGIVSNSRAEKTSAIPGVAIATALLPPLCVSGYGLASGQFDIFINSFYLFFLNAVFVALATYLVVRFLRFPYKEHLNARERRRAQWITTAFVIIIMAPSGYILYTVLDELREKNAIDAFVTECLDNNYRQINWERVSYGDTLHELKVYVLGQPIPTDSITILNNTMRQNYHIRSNTLLNVIQMDIPDQLNAEQVENLNNLESERSRMLQALESGQQAIQRKDETIRVLQNQLDSLQNDTIPFYTARVDVKTFYPELLRLGFAEATQTKFDDSDQAVPVLLVEWDNRKLNRVQRGIREERLMEFFKHRFGLDTLVIVRY